MSLTEKHQYQCRAFCLTMLDYGLFSNNVVVYCPPLLDYVVQQCYKVQSGINL